MGGWPTSLNILIKMGGITDEDIAVFLNDDNFREILSCIDTQKHTQKLVINLILYIFNSPESSKTDWLQDIINLITNKYQCDTILVPSLQKRNMNDSFDKIIQSLNSLERGQTIYVDGVLITYEMFNDFVDALYSWFLEGGLD